MITDEYLQKINLKKDKEKEQSINRLFYSKNIIKNETYQLKIKFQFHYF